MDNDILYCFPCDSGAVKKLCDFLDNEGDIEVKDNACWTFLIYACVYGRIDIVKELLERGANVNNTTNKNKTALMYACRYHNHKIARLLIINGADVFQEDIYGKTFLEYIGDVNFTEEMKDYVNSLNFDIKPAKQE